MKKEMKAYTIVFTKNEIQNIIKENKFNDIKTLFKTFTNKGTAPSVREIKRIIYNRFRNDKSFSLVYYEYSKKLKYTITSLLSKQDQLSYELHKVHNYEFVLYSTGIRKQKLKDL